MSERWSTTIYVVGVVGVMKTLGDTMVKIGEGIE